MDEVGVFCEVGVLSVWEAMKGDVYMHFAVNKLIPLS